MLRRVVASGAFASISFVPKVVKSDKVPIDKLGLKKFEVMAQVINHNVSHFEIVMNEGVSVGFVKLD